MKARYDIYLDDMTDDEYCDWSVKLFNSYDKILNKNGVILYNMSYGTEKPYVLWLTLSDIIRNTNFMIADCIIWKKKTALPNNVSKNKLTRITEFVLLFVVKMNLKHLIVIKKYYLKVKLDKIFMKIFIISLKHQIMMVLVS